MLATTALGGVWSSCSPDFGAQGALDRFGQIEPKVLFACDGYHYNGQTIDIRDKVAQVAGQTASITKIIWISMIGRVAGQDTVAELVKVSGAPEQQPRPDEHPSSGAERPAPAGAGPAQPGAGSTAGNARQPAFAQLDFNDPLYILYSSGTTGKPKCIVHGVGGTLLQHLKEHQLHVDLTRDDKLFFFTTCGWIDVELAWSARWRPAARWCSTTARPFIAAPAPFGTLQREKALPYSASVPSTSPPSINSGSSRATATTCLPCARCSPPARRSPTKDSATSYRDVKRDLHLVSMTGGTDLISCFILGNPNLPVYAGELQCKGLGMAVEVWDEAGRRVQSEKGELVCTRSFPSCPIGFWQDPGAARFRATYFEKYPNVWTQGDFAEVTDAGGFIVHGRSDAVLNPGGVRIGTAEIYRQVERIDDVIDAVCVGQEWDGDTRILLFVVLRPGASMTAALADTIRATIRTHASPRHVPRKIIAVSDIPRTMNGKIAELAVRGSHSWAAGAEHHCARQSGSP